MSKQWACNEHECGVVVTAADLDELVTKVNEHFAEAHDSYELEEMIEDAAIKSPISIEPVSPINTRARYQLCGKNPAHIPINDAEIKVARAAR